MSFFHVLMNSHILVKMSFFFTQRFPWIIFWQKFYENKTTWKFFSEKCHTFSISKNLKKWPVNVILFKMSIRFRPHDIFRASIRQGVECHFETVPTSEGPRRDHWGTPEGPQRDPGGTPERPQKDPGGTPEISIEVTHSFQKFQNFVQKWPRMSLFQLKM